MAWQFLAGARAHETDGKTLSNGRRAQLLMLPCLLSLPPPPLLHARSLYSPCLLSSLLLLYTDLISPVWRRRWRDLWAGVGPLPYPLSHGPCALALCFGSGHLPSLSPLLALLSLFALSLLSLSLCIFAISSSRHFSSSSSLTFGLASFGLFGIWHLALWFGGLGGGTALSSLISEKRIPYI